MDGILQTREDELWVDTTFHMLMACISAHPLFYSTLISGPSHKQLVVRCGFSNCSNFVTTTFHVRRGLVYITWQANFLLCIASIFSQHPLQLRPTDRKFGYPYYSTCPTLRMYTVFLAQLQTKKLLAETLNCLQQTLSVCGIACTPSDQCHPLLYSAASFGTNRRKHVLVVRT